MQTPTQNPESKEKVERHDTDRAPPEKIIGYRRGEGDHLKALTQAGRAHLANFLSEASALLGKSLDYATTLDNVARLSVPFFADYCVVDIATDDQLLERVKIARFDSAQEEPVVELSRRYPPKQEATAGSYKVFRTAKTEFVWQIDNETQSVSAADEIRPLLLHAHKPRSYISVPLRGHRSLLGVITFFIAESGRRYGPEDVHLAEELAQRCAFAIDNARLYQRAREQFEAGARTQELLAMEKERLAVTLYSIGDGVITTDASGRVMLLNKAAERLTGWSQRDAVGVPLARVFHVIDMSTQQECDDPVEKVLSGADFVLPYQATLISKDLRETVIADSAAPIRDKNGYLIGIVVVFRDVTKEHKMEQALARVRNLESIGLLAAGIAHDFNNIMTAILGNVSLAKVQVGPAIADDARASFAAAEQAFARARELTQQLLTFAKGGAPVKKTASIKDVVTHTVQFFLSGSNVRCNFAFAENLRPVDFDTGQLSRAIDNLVINAKEAMAEGGVLRVTADNIDISDGNEYLPPGAYIKLTVQDTGAGIAENDLNQVFDPYFTTKPHGSGLGLTTTHSIIQRHGGQIEVESEVGRGTVFTVYLPASGGVDPTPSAPVEPKKMISPRLGKVLVMDDEEIIRTVLGKQLNHLGYEAEMAQDGAEALVLYENASRSSRPFSAVIMDLTIPGGMGGKECLEKLKESDPDVKAIVSSGYSDDPVMADYEKYGFRQRIVKPYQLEELSWVLHEVFKSERSLI